MYLLIAYAFCTVHTRNLYAEKNELECGVPIECMGNLKKKTNRIADLYELAFCRQSKHFLRCTVISTNVSSIWIKQ